MSNLAVDIHWTRKEAELKPQSYSAEHDIVYSPAFAIKADTAPDWGGNPENTNPEQAMAASLSSCHMMTFLALCAKAGWPVATYSDHAVAHLGRNAKGKTVVTQIDLKPDVTFDDDFTVTPEDMAKMQERAHRYCFIANTLAGNVEMTLG